MNKTILKFTLGGFLAGLLFPVLSTLLYFLLEGKEFGFGTVIELHRGNPLQQIIDVAPIILGSTGFLIGRGQNQLEILKEKAEADSEKFFSISLELLCIARQDGYFLKLNPAWTTVLGYSIEELKAKPFIERIHPDDVQNTLNEMSALSEGLTTINFENRYLHQNGSWVWLSWNSRQDKSGLIFAAARDITPMKDLSQSLQENLQVTRGILNSADYSIIATNTDGKVTLFNHTAEKLLGYKAEEVVGKPPPTAMHDPKEVGKRAKELSLILGRDIVPSLEVFYALPAHTGEPDEHDWTYIHRDGTRFPVRLSVTCLRDEKGNVTGFIGIAKDMRELKEAEESLREYALELERSNRELDQFAYVVSHDLKAPLRAINNLAEWISEDWAEGNTEEIPKHLSLLQGRVHRLGNLIEAILQYARIGKKATSPEEFEVKEMLQQLLELLDPPANFDIQLPELPLHLSGHKLMLQQVFMNLIANALKYNDKEKGEIRITWKTEKEWVEFRVTDNGPGIPDQFKERIFGMFQRLEARDDVEGTGIGLAIVKKVIDNQEGNIFVESEAGGGASFVFTWPIRI